MKRKTSVAAILIIAMTTTVACSDRPGNDDVLAQDTSLARDLALANQDTSSQPQLADVPVTTMPVPVETEPEPAPPPRVRRRSEAPPPAPRRTSRRPAPLPPPEPPADRITESGNTETASDRGSERPIGVVSAGSEIALASGQRICTNTNSVGDSFTAQIAEPVMGANGTVVPVGATALVTISSLERSERTGDNIEIGLRVESITFGGKTYPVTSDVTYAQVDRMRAESRGDDVKKVVTGAAIGAVIGQILGRKTKSTVIGAATGAAAGAVVAGRNADYDGCIPSGGRITIRLTEPLTIQVAG